MAQTYLNSGSVSVFPLSMRRLTMPNDNALSERNLSNILLSIVDKSSFVISKNADEEDFHFVVGGYRFIIYKMANFLATHSTWNKVYALVKVNKENPSAPYLMGTDYGENYQGLILSNESTTESSTSTKEIFELLILEKDGVSGEWKIPSDSTTKFTQSSLGNLDIDGGELD